ncbi:MAG: hypothetical protein M3Q07_20035, partial [Pseudobdellovibrionaceae bacterium]|nr:hypothetical protein [Pseudobdellovibrionaceae bacterium]
RQGKHSPSAVPSVLRSLKISNQSLPRVSRLEFSRFAIEDGAVLTQPRRVTANAAVFSCVRPMAGEAGRASQTVASGRPGDEEQD